MSKLALLGGNPVISNRVQISRNRFTSSDIEEVYKYFDTSNINSYYGDEGLQHQYESELQSYFSRQYCVLLNSGTNSLFAAYFALGLMPNDEVIVPAFSFFAVASPLLLLHTRIILADCDKFTGLIDFQDVIKKITDKTKAVVINYIGGDSPVDLIKFTDILHQKGISIIEDISLAFGASNYDIKLGRLGDIACCSLGSTKLLSGGQGGFIVTNSREYYERIVLLGHFGQRSNSNVLNPFYRQFSRVSYGLNLRMHPLAIAISYSRFKNLDELIKMRHQRYKMLSDCLDGLSYINAPRETNGIFRGSWHGYFSLLSDSVELPSGQCITDALNAEGICVSYKAHYPLLHKEKIYTSQEDGIFRSRPNPYKIGTEQNRCIGAEFYNEHILSFPLFLDEDISVIKNYCAAIDKVFSNLPELIDYEKRLNTRY